VFISSRGISCIIIGIAPVGRVDGILDREELEIPSLQVMRRTANTVLKQEMAEIGAE